MSHRTAAELSKEASLAIYSAVERLSSNAILPTLVRVEFGEATLQGQKFYFNLVVRAEDVRNGD